MDAQEVGLEMVRGGEQQQLVLVAVKIEHLHPSGSLFWRSKNAPRSRLELTWR